MFERRNLVWKVLALAWALKIFFLSTSAFSSNRSRSYFAQLLRDFAISISPMLFAALHLMVRKSAHMVAFGVLAMLVYRAILPDEKFQWRFATAWRAFALSAAYAATDELHQVFVANRTAAFTDLGFDALGAAIGLSLLYVYARLRKPRVAKIEAAR